jgi:hypothetical protein
MVSTVKNIRAIVDSPAYEAFGFLVQNKVNQAAYIYRRALTHTTGGGLYYRKFNIAAQLPGDPILIHSDSLNISGVSGGMMDNDSIVIFYVSNHTDVYHSRDIYIVKCDTNFNFSAPHLFDWTGITQLQAGFFFGQMIPGDNPGENYHIMYQTNGDTGSTRYRISFFKTTDYWTHYSQVGTLIDSTLDYSETSGVNLSGGKFVALARKNNAGSLTPFESTNYGVTWTRRTASNLFWYLGGIPSIPNTYENATKDSFDIFYECRDVSMMQISRGNTVANFGNATPVYNDPEIYAYHRGTGGNPSLGYGSEVKLSKGTYAGKYLTVYSKEYNNNRANIQWTMDDLTTDPAGVPAAPTLATSSITTTSFRVDITGYSDEDWTNVRYCLMDLSTDAGFSTFVTAKYRNTSAFPAVSINNLRMTGYFDIYSTLTTGTTYYLRIKACNNAGCSSYTTVNVTTL